jgi:hypothetical protein
MGQGPSAILEREARRDGIQVPDGKMAVQAIRIED